MNFVCLEPDLVMDVLPTLAQDAPAFALAALADVPVVVKDVIAIIDASVKLNSFDLFFTGPPISCDQPTHAGHKLLTTCA